jgi:hypothetical protein
VDSVVVWHVRGATQERPERVDGRLDRSFEAEDEACSISAERERAPAWLVNATHYGAVDRFDKPLDGTHGSTRRGTKVHRGRGRWRRWRDVLCDLDARARANFNSRPNGAAIGGSRCDDCEHRIDQIVEVEEIAASTPRADNEAKSYLLQSHQPTCADQLPPCRLAPREKQSGLPVYENTLRVFVHCLNHGSSRRVEGSIE